MIRLLVDSSADYSPEEISAKHLYLAPLSVQINNETYQDGVDLFKENFYQLLISSKDFPKTSQPSPQLFLEIFEKAQANQETIIAILLSSDLSGTYQSAHIAKEMIDYDQIYLIDSRLATAGIQILTETALKWIDEGKAAKDIVEKLEDLKNNIRTYANLDTLEYLAKGGRLSKTVASIGEMVSLKPTIALQDGKIEVVAKKPGAARALIHFSKMIDAYAIDESYPVFTLYTNGTSHCEKFEEKYMAHHQQPKRLRLGPSLGSHIGPEAYGICFVEKKL